MTKPELKTTAEERAHLRKMHDQSVRPVVSALLVDDIDILIAKVADLQSQLNHQTRERAAEWERAQRAEKSLEWLSASNIAPLIARAVKAEARVQELEASNLAMQTEMVELRARQDPSCEHVFAPYQPDLYSPARSFCLKCGFGLPWSPGFSERGK